MNTDARNKKKIMGFIEMIWLNSRKTGCGLDVKKLSLKTYFCSDVGLVYF